MYSYCRCIEGTDHVSIIIALFRSEAERRRRVWKSINKKARLESTTYRTIMRHGSLPFTASRGLGFTITSIAFYPL